MSKDVEYKAYADYRSHVPTLSAMYYMALDTLTEYVLRPDYKRMQDAKTCVIRLAFALADRMYIIEDDRQKQYVAHLLSHPAEFQHIEDITAIFAVLQKVLYELGLTKIESARISPHEAHKELE